MRKMLFVLCVVLVTLALAMTVSGQDATPSITVNDQVVLNDTVTIASVVSDGPGIVVIYNDSGRGSPAAVVGNATVAAGTSTDVVVPLNAGVATPLLFAALHQDTGDEGLNRADGADPFATVNDEPVRASFSAPLISIGDQLVAENTVTADVVTIGGPGWLAVHADNEGGPGPVIGQTLLEPGRNKNVTVELAAEGQTAVLWPMLHVDTGEAGVYEFGAVEGADAPVIVGDTVAVLPIWTVPHIAVADQAVTDSVTASEVFCAAACFLVIHQDADGSPGGVAGWSDPLPAGLNTDVVITVDPALLTPVLWPMLHDDTGEEGTYEFGSVEGADLPVSVDGNVVTFPISTSDCTVTVSGAANANVRSGPATDSSVLSTLPSGGEASVVGQSGGGEFVWWELADGGWIRSDVVTEAGNCEGVPVTESVPGPAATEEAGS